MKGCAWTDFYLLPLSFSHSFSEFTLVLSKCSSFMPQIQKLTCQVDRRLLLSIGMNVSDPKMIFYPMKDVSLQTGRLTKCPLSYTFVWHSWTQHYPHTQSTYCFPRPPLVNLQKHNATYPAVLSPLFLYRAIFNKNKLNTHAASKIIHSPTPILSDMNNTAITCLANSEWSWSSPLTHTLHYCHRDVDTGL